MFTNLLNFQKIVYVKSKISKLPGIMKTLLVIMPSTDWVHTKHAIHILVHLITIH